MKDLIQKREREKREGKRKKKKGAGRGRALKGLPFPLKSAEEINRPKPGSTLRGKAVERRFFCVIRSGSKKQGGVRNRKSPMETESPEKKLKSQQQQLGRIQRGKGSAVRRREAGRTEKLGLLSSESGKAKKMERNG